MAIRDPMHNYNHFMVMGCLRGSFQRDHSRYLRQRTRPLLTITGSQVGKRADNIFAEFWSAVPNPDIRAAHHNSWILEEM